MERFSGDGEGNNRAVSVAVRENHPHIAATQPS